MSDSYIRLSTPFITGNEIKYIKECLNSGWVATGDYIEKFEKIIASHVGASYAVACVNGTTGLYLSLQLAGIGIDEEVIVPTLTFISPVNVVRHLMAEPIFMDCDDFMNLDPDKLEDFCSRECQMTARGLKNKKTDKIIRAIIPVHIFGNPCRMGPIMEVADKYNLKVIEDATESLGSFYTEGIYGGKYTGTIGNFGVFSFNGNKIITTGGGGMIVTDDEKMAERAKYLANQAKDDPIRYVHNEIGYNFRLSNIQAAMGVAQMEKLDEFITIKKRNYELYLSLLQNVEGLSLLGIPSGTSPNYWFYSLIVEKEKYGMGRDELLKALEDRKIQSRPLWHLNHLQKPYLDCQSYRIEKALWFNERVLNIPCSSNLTEKEVEFVVSTLKELKKSG